MSSETAKARAELRHARRLPRGPAREAAVHAAERALTLAIKRAERRRAQERAGALPPEDDQA